MRGGQHQLLLLMPELAEHGHENILLASERGPLWQAALQAGFAVSAARLNQVWRYSKQAEIVHAHDARAHTLAAIGSRHRFVVSRRVAFRIGRSIASRWKYQRAARFLAISHFVAHELQAAGVESGKIDVVYDAVDDVKPAAEWSAAYPAVALASKDPQKGRDLVEQAAIMARMPVLFSHDLVHDLARASMFVYITRSEGLGSAALLAMSMGVPVVASNTGGLSEIFANEDCGVLVNNQPREIAAAMGRVRDEPGLAAALIQRAKARVTEAFTKQHLVTRTLASYERALAP